MCTIQYINVSQWRCKLKQQGFKLDNYLQTIYEVLIIICRQCKILKKQCNEVNKFLELKEWLCHLKENITDKQLQCKKKLRSIEDLWFRITQFLISSLNNCPDSRIKGDIQKNKILQPFMRAKKQWSKFHSCLQQPLKITKLWNQYTLAILLFDFLCQDCEHIQKKWKLQGLTKGLK